MRQLVAVNDQALAGVRQESLDTVGEAWPAASAVKLRSGWQNLLIAVRRGDPTGMCDALLEVTIRPEDAQ